LRSYVEFGWELAQVEGLTDVAMDAFGEAIALDPRFAPAHFGLAELRRWMRQFELALPHYEACLEAEPSNGRALAGRAECRLHAGDSAGAQQDLESAVKCAPEDEIVHQLVTRLQGEG